MPKISEIELLPIRAQDGLAFFANFVIDNSFYVGNVAVFTKRNGSGFRCVYPTKKLNNGTQVPLFYPINNEVGQVIEEAITQKAQELLISE